MQYSRVIKSGELFPLLGLKRQIKKVDSRSQKESCMENATWLENSPLKEACYQQKEQCRNEDYNPVIPPTLQSSVALHWLNPMKNGQGAHWWSLIRTASKTHSKVENEREWIQGQRDNWLKGKPPKGVTRPSSNYDRNMKRLSY